MQRLDFISQSIAFSLAPSGPDELLRRLKNHKNDVVALNITHIQDNVLTDIIVRPKTIRDFPGAHHSVTRSHDIISRAVRAAFASEPRKHGMFADVRWSIQYLGWQRNVIQEIFLAGTQNDGYINGIAVEFETDALRSFLRQYFDGRTRY